MVTKLTLAEVVRAVRYDRTAAYCRHTPSNTLVTPREVWLLGAAMWVQTDGRRVSAPLRGFLRPGPLGAWRIRRAFRNRHLPIQGLL